MRNGTTFNDDYSRGNTHKDNDEASLSSTLKALIDEVRLLPQNQIPARIARTSQGRYIT